MEDLKLLKSTVRGLSYRYQALKKINSLLAYSSSSYEFLDSVLAMITDIFSAEAAAVILKDKKSHLKVKLFHAHMPNEDKKAAEKEIRDIPVGINETGLEKIESDNFTPLVEDSPAAEAQYRKKIKKHLGSLESVAAVAVRSGNTTVGIIEIYNFPSFSKDKKESFFSIGAQVGFSLEILKRLRGLRQRAKVMRKITSITEAISEPRHLDTVLDMIIGKLLDFFEADGCSIFLKTRQGNIEFAAVSGDKKDLLPGKKLKSGEGIVSWAIEKKWDVLVRNTAEDKRFSPKVDTAAGIKTSSVICAPLKVLDEVIGAVEVLRSDSSFPFNEEDLDLLVIIASHASLAIDKASMYGLKDRWLNSLAELLTRVIDSSKDARFPGHSANVRKYARLIADQLNLNSPDKHFLDIAAAVKDIGKLATPDKIMSKKDKLSDEEWDKLRQYPLKSVELLQTMEDFRSIIPVIKYHCENYNGTGYPYKLKGDEIPLLARILALSDAFAAMMSPRPYRRALSIEEAKDEIVNQKGQQFDPKIVEALLKALKSSAR